MIKIQNLNQNQKHGSMPEFDPLHVPTRADPTPLDPLAASLASLAPLFSLAHMDTGVAHRRRGHLQIGRAHV